MTNCQLDPGVGSFAIALGGSLEQTETLPSGIPCSLRSASYGHALTRCDNQTRYAIVTI